MKYNPFLQTEKPPALKDILRELPVGAHILGEPYFPKWAHQADRHADPLG